MTFFPRVFPRWKIDYMLISNILHSIRATTLFEGQTSENNIPIPMWLDDHIHILGLFHWCNTCGHALMSRTKLIVTLTTQESTYDTSNCLDLRPLNLASHITNFPPHCPICHPRKEIVPFDARCARFRLKICILGFLLFLVLHEDYTLKRASALVVEQILWYLQMF